MLVVRAQERVVTVMVVVVRLMEVRLVRLQRRVAEANTEEVRLVVIRSQEGVAENVMVL